MFLPFTICPTEKSKNVGAIWGHILSSPVFLEGGKDTARDKCDAICQIYYDKF